MMTTNKEVAKDSSTTKKEVSKEDASTTLLSPYDLPLGSKKEDHHLARREEKGTEGGEVPETQHELVHSFRNDIVPIPTPRLSRNVNTMGRQTTPGAYATAGGDGPNRRPNISFSALGGPDQAAATAAATSGDTPTTERENATSDCVVTVGDLETPPPPLSPSSEMVVARRTQESSESRLSEATPIALFGDGDDDLPHARQVDSSQLNDHHQQRQEKQTMCCYGIVTVCLLLFVILVVVFSVGMGTGEKDSVGLTTNNSPIVPPTASAVPSSAPTSVLDLALQQGLPDSSIQNIYAEDQTGTPQQKAYEWLANHPNITNLEPWKMEQLFAMVTFYFGLEGEKWPDELKSTWLDYTTDECYWITTPLELMYGISLEYVHSDDFDFRQCNDAGQVQTIFLLHLQLSNVEVFIPPELALLSSSLKVLALLSSGFRASVSDMFPSEITTQLSNLDLVALHDNSISGTIPTDSIAQLTGLRHLIITHNQISGTIPSELGAMSNNLQQLYLSVNSLSGPIPNELGLLTRMTDIDLDYNSLNGPIPTEFGRLASLKRLTLLDNSLTGPIPSELGLLTSLDMLMLDHNSMSGSIPSSFGMLTSISTLMLEDNDLTGTLPSQLDNLVSGASGNFSSSLKILTLTNNRLSGTVSNELCSISSGGGLEFDCGEDLCGCHFCNCSETAAHVVGNGGKN